MQSSPSPLNSPTPAQQHALDLGEFVTASPSSFHAVAEAVRRLTESGFSPLIETEAWSLNAGKYYVQRDGAVIAFVIPQGATAATGFRILGSHTDSPTFKLKPKPTTSSFGWLQAGVEVYGGPLLNSWLDRELVLAGRIVTHDGTEVLTRTAPLLRFPQLAIHLDRGVNEGLKLDPQRHMNPIWGTGRADEQDLLAVLAEAAGIDPLTIGGYDVVACDAQAPALFGATSEFLASARLDNLSSVHASLVALQSVADESLSQIPMLAAFDHEEIGSASRSGAAGPFLEEVVRRIGFSLGGSTEDSYRAIADSICLSSDAGHAIHPNYPERHDPANQPLAGKGPLLKINANQRYSTDAVSAAAWTQWCAQADAPYQEFVSNNAMPCGSTIGPITATRLGIRTLDVGVPLLSMHSAREMAHVEDLYGLARIAQEFFTHNSK